MTGTQQGTAKISFCFATIDRPHCARRLIRSIRQHFPAAPIFVGDQSAQEPDQAAFYQEQGVTAVYLAYDSGVCHARNAVVAQVRTAYFVLCDDDFIVDADANFDLALKIFEHNSHVMVVGGRVVDIENAETRQGADRHWESFLFLDQRAKLLVQLPIYSFRPLEGSAGDHRFFYCDAVLNFAMMRTALFQQHGHRWDERFKCNGEHEDFYLSLKARKGLRVAYIPEMVAYHHNVSDGDYGALRYRQEGWMLLAEKWGMDQFYDCFKDLNLRFFSGASEAAIDSSGFWQGLVDLPHGTNEQVFFRRRSHDLAAEITDLHGNIGELKKEIEGLRAEQAAMTDASNPNHAASWVRLGQVAKEAGNLQAAYAAYEKSLEIAPTAADTHLQIGHLLKLMNDTSGAMASFQRALELDGTLFDAERELRMLRQGATSFAEVESTSFLDPTPRLLCDLSDAFLHLRHHATVSGIQRVQLGIADAILSRTSATPYQAVFITEADGGGGYVEIEARHLVRLIAELKNSQVSHESLQDIVVSASRNGYRYKCRKGDVIVFLGAFWVLSDVIERAADLKEQGAVIGTLIHDIIPLTHPEFSDASLTGIFQMVCAGVLQMSDFILTVSDHSGRAVQRYLDDQGTTSGPIMTVRPAHQTWGPTTLPVAPSKAIESIRAEPYVLYVSTMEIRKNHVFLFQIWKMLQAAGDVAVPLLVFVGRPGWRIRDFMEQIESTHGLEGRIRLIHGVSDAELANLYRHAQFTVFPSFEEGWGLPVGESLMFGRPCVASNTSSIPEVGGAFVDYVDPFNATEGYQIIRRFITDAGYREARAAQIRRDFKPRLWDEVAHDLVGLVAKVTRDENFQPRQLARPTLEGGQFYQLGHLDDLSHFITHGAGRIVHSLFDSNWYPLEGFGRWMRAPAGRVIFNAQLEGASSIVIMVVFNSPSWISGNQIAISIAGEPVGLIDVVGGAVQQAMLTGPVAASPIEIKFEIVGPIAPGPDARQDLCFGLRAIAYLPVRKSARESESALLTAVGAAVVDRPQISQ